MFLIFTAIFASMISVLSGIYVIGNGQHFRFSLHDILDGRRDAALYVWITFSTIFGLLHCGALLEYGLNENFLYRTYDTGLWMMIHTGVGVMNTIVHFFIKTELDRGDAHLLHFWKI